MLRLFIAGRRVGFQDHPEVTAMGETIVGSNTGYCTARPRRVLSVVKSESQERRET